MKRSRLEPLAVLAILLPPTSGAEEADDGLLSDCYHEGRATSLAARTFSLHGDTLPRTGALE